jgi:hypothetical protein
MPISNEVYTASIGRIKLISNPISLNPSSPRKTL